MKKIIISLNIYVIVYLCVNSINRSDALASTALSIIVMACCPTFDNVLNFLSILLSVDIVIVQGNVAHVLVLVVVGH